MDERQEYEELKQTIDHHMDRYYNADDPEITDVEYDALMRRLKALERAHPDWVTPDSPTQKVGGTAKREAGIPVTHNVPMRSIEDVFTKEEVSAWVSEVRRVHPDARFCVEEKIDGLSMTLRYQDGALILAETRGDGLVGEDVTENARVIPNVRQTIGLPGYLEVRGEVYMTHADFARYNEEREAEGERPAANPRNLAAGTLRQLDSAVVKKRGLRMLLFNVQDAREYGAGDEEKGGGRKGVADALLVSHAAGMDLLRKEGFATVDHTLCETPEEILSAIDAIGERRGALDHDIDGAVVKIDQIAYRADFPAGTKYSAGHIAYKYPPEEKEVEIEKIEVGVGRTGKMTFRALFAEPVRLCGTNVSKATLHNIDFINSMGISEGCRAVCRKQGDIIPAIVRVTKRAESPFAAPRVCPVCGAPLYREEDSCDIYCANPSCPAQLARTLTYFAGKDAMDIKNFGPRYIEALIDAGYLREIPDIYCLRDHREELIEQGFLGREKNTDRILAAIEESKNNGPERLLTGYAIRNVGRISAREIMRRYHSLWDLADASVEELMALPDVGGITARAIHTFYADGQHRAMQRRLEDLGLHMETEEPAREDGPGPLAGMTFVVTGTLAHFTRSEIAEVIEQNGGKCAGSVSKNTDYLVAGENAGSKLLKARQLGIPVLGEEEFAALFERETGKPVNNP